MSPTSSVSLYRCAGFRISSSRVLPGLSRAAAPNAEPDLIVEWPDGPAPAAGDVLFRWPGRFGLTLHRDADGWTWTTRGGDVVTSHLDGDVERLRCFAADDGRRGLLASVLVRRILPRIAARRGRLVLHAAACATARGAVLIPGTSGVGKSTLVTALHGAGATMLGDDLTALVVRDAAAYCPVSATGACLWPDALAGVGGAEQSSEVLPGYDAKRWHPLPAEVTADAPRVREVWLPARANRIDEDQSAPVQLRPVEPADAMTRLWPLVIIFHPRDVESKRAAWTALAALVASAPVAVLRYARGFDRLPTVASALVARLDGSLPYDA